MRGTDTDARMECSYCGEPVNKPHTQGCLIGLVRALETERDELRARLEAVREWRHRKKTHLMKTKIPVGRAGLLELSHILSDLPNSGEDQLNTLSHPGKGGG